MNHTILMLEHDDDDRYITQAVFDENRYPVSLQFVSDSRELTGYLQRCAKDGTELPALILLNYHAFPTNGLGVLHDLKANPAFKHIPVVVLSGSIHPDIIRQCYDAGASSFIQKPSMSDETNTKIQNFIRYWFQTVELS